jgi:preprotein translocase subunit SecG
MSNPVDAASQAISFLFCFCDLYLLWRLIFLEADFTARKGSLMIGSNNPLGDSMDGVGVGGRNMLKRMMAIMVLLFFFVIICLCVQRELMLRRSSARLIII